MELKTISVSDVVPSGTNPRQDMGDLDRLAKSIEATGGEPLNPIVVVQDGSKYRVIDGERRWRAMSKLGTSQCRAIVFGCVPNAIAALDAVATDDKLRLTNTEKGAGFQEMITLGVDDELISLATGVETEHVRRYRNSKKGNVENMTLDAMLASAYDEFSEDEQEDIRHAYNPDMRAGEIRREHRLAKAKQEIKDALPEGIEYTDKPAPYDFQFEKLGVVYIDSVSSVRDATRFKGEHPDGGGITAYDDSSTTKPCFVLFRDMEQTDKDAIEAQKSEIAMANKEAVVAYNDLLEWSALHNWAVLGDMAKEARNRHFADDEDIPDDVAALADHCAPSSYEVVDYARRHMFTERTFGEFSFSDRITDAWTQAYDAAVSKGYEPCPEAQRTYERIQREVDE